MAEPIRVLVLPRNPSGSFKDGRASPSVPEASWRGYPGEDAATSSNYGAALVSQAAKSGLPSVIVQEAFDSRRVAQPEIAEKTRACEAYDAEVIRLWVGPELFYVFLRVLKDSGFVNWENLLGRVVNLGRFHVNH